MESRRPPTTSSETLRAAAEAPIQSTELVSKDVKTKKASLPASAILNTKAEADNAQLNIDKGSEKNGWDIEALFGTSEQKEEKAHELPDEPEKLSDPEAREAVGQYVDDRSETVEAEISEVDEDSPLATIAAANQALLEKLRTQVQTSEKPAEEIITEATHATIEELRLTESEQEDTPVDHAKPAPIVAPHPVKVRQQEAAIASILAEEKPTEEPESESESETMPMPVSDDLMRAVQTSENSRTRSTESKTATAIARSQTEVSLNPNYTRRDVAQGVLVGGVAGYMVGRRSGRKRAEAAAKPMQEQLRSEIDALQKKIVKNEQLVRSLAAQKVAKEHAGRTSPQAAYKELAPKPRHETTHLVATNKVVQPRKIETPQVAKSPLAERPVPNSLSQMTPERPLPSHGESDSVVKLQPRQEQVRAVMSIEKMPLEDVLVIARHVKVDGKSLESYYKQGHLTEHAVRTILVEQRRTGRAERAFYKHRNLHETHVRSSSEARDTNTSSTSATDRTSLGSGAHAPTTISVPTHIQSADSPTAQHSVDRIHADNTPRIGMTATIGVILAVIFAFFLAKILFA